MAELSVVQLFPQTDDHPVVLPPIGQEQLRAVEAILFASAEPVPEAELRKRVPVGTDLPAILQELQRTYTGRGFNVVRVARGWAFRTAADLAHLMTREVIQQRRLSRPALEMLAIIAYHQPVTRNEIEDIRGVSTSKGTLDLLIELGWVRISGRREAPGRPVTYGTTDTFLQHFNLDRVSDLPGVEELAAAGLLEKNAMAVPENEPPDESDDVEDDDIEPDRPYLEDEGEADV
jgi:segregation and condensation protein B